MNALSKYSFILFLLIIGACNKIELPVEEPDEVVFNISADTEFGSLNIEAGIDNFVLRPNYFEDDKEVLTFEANFEKDDCVVNCKEKLTIKIRDNQQKSGINAGLFNYEVPLVDTISYDSLVPKMVLDLDAENSIVPFNQGNLYTWEIGNTVTTIEDNPRFEGVDLTNFTPNQPFEVTLNLATNLGQGCTSYQTQNLQFQNINQECSVSIQTDSSGNLVAIPNQGSTPPYLFFWNTNDTSQTISPNPLVDEYSVIFIDGNGCKASSGVNYSLGNEECSASFSADFRMANDTFNLEKYEPNLFEFSKVIIEYTNEDGEFFSTENGEQNGSYINFEVLSVEDYNLSPDNKQTKKLVVQFACQLFNEDGTESIEFLNGKGSIAVAYIP